MPVTLTFHDSQYPARMADQLRQGLRTKRLSSKFLYASPAQAQRWLAYHQAYSPSRTEPDLVRLYTRAFRAALHDSSKLDLHYVSLGCGGGMKDVLFLQEALPSCQRLSFTPLDTSAALVIETMLRLQSTLPDLAQVSFPLVADLETQPDLAPLWATAETPDTRRLLACFGMLPNFDYHTFLPYVRSLMRPGDLLLLSANLSPQPFPDAVDHILPQYDNAPARAWFMGLLDSLGFSTADLELRIAAQALRDDGQVWQITAAVHFLRLAQVTLDDETFGFPAGDQLHLFFSNRFTPQAMPQVLQAAGLHAIATFLFATGEEGIYLCAPSA
jgi:uncharacterized SAM-dependent methyltransferase